MPGLAGNVSIARLEARGNALRENKPPMTRLVNRRLAQALLLASLFAHSALADNTTTEQVIVTPNATTLLPAADHIWSPDDYEAAYIILSRLPPEKLPDASTPLFARMINPENLGLARDADAPMSNRLLLTQRYLLATAKITACYLPDIKTNPQHRESVTGFEGLFVHELGLLMSELREIAIVQKPDFDTAALLDPKVEKIKAGLDKIVGDMILSLKAPQTRSKASLQRLTQALREEYPNLEPFLSPETRANAQRTLSNPPQ
jgi:hypothetical protein